MNTYQNFSDLYLQKFLRSVEKKTYHINDSVGTKFLTRLRFSFHHFCEPKFRHNFKGTLNLLCASGIEAETITHFFLRCHSTMKTEQSL